MMKLDIKTFLMVMVLISLFSGTNAYIFFRLDGWLALGWGWPLYLLGMLLGCWAFIFIIWHPLPIKPLYQMMAWWFGFIIFAGIVFVAAELAAIILPDNERHLAIAALAIAVGLSAYAAFNNRSVPKVVFVEVPAAKISKPLRLVLIADTHISGFHQAGYLAGIVEAINQHEPDMVCISGDFADGSTPLAAIAPIDAIQAPVYLVMGNHEVWNNHDGRIEQLLGQTRVEILGQAENNGVALFGVHFENRRHALRDGLQKMAVGAGRFNILLYHEPREVNAAREAGIDLMLCGHTHGGQMIPWNYVTRMSYKHLKGLFPIENMHLYVSQGTGVWGPPMRLGSFNEITVIDLKPVATSEHLQ